MDLRDPLTPRNISLTVRAAPAQMRGQLTACRGVGGLLEHTKSAIGLLLIRHKAAA